MCVHRLCTIFTLPAITVNTLHGPTSTFSLSSRSASEYRVSNPFGIRLGGSFRAPTKNEDPLIASLSALESKKERTSIDSGVGSSNGDASDDESVTMESKKDL